MDSKVDKVGMGKELGPDLITGLLSHWIRVRWAYNFQDASSYTQAWSLYLFGGLYYLVGHGRLDDMYVGCYLCGDVYDLFRTTTQVCADRFD